MAGDVPVDERALITPSAVTPGATPRTALAGLDPAQSTTGLAATGATSPDAAGAAASGGPGADPGSTAGTASGAAGSPASSGGERALHHYGRVQVLGRPRDPAAGAMPGPLGIRPAAALLPPADGSVVSTVGLTPGLNRAETLGLDAFRLRASSAYRRLKAARPRDGHAWDMDRPCTDVPPPRGAGSGAGVVPGAGPAGGEGPDGGDAGGDPTAAATPRALANGFSPLLAPGATLAAPGGADTGAAGATPTAGAASAPTSARLEGSVAIGLIMVEGPTADLQFSAAERTKVVAEVQNGLSWYATTNPAAELSFHYDIQIVRLSVAPNPHATDLEALWRDPTMDRLGFAADFDGVYAYVDALRSRLRTAWSYCVFFTKYPVGYFAYSSIGGPRIVMSYANDGWGPDNIDRVFTHETGHIFGAPDEYGGADCDCGGQWGVFATPNGNCDTCAPSPVDCLMRSNAFTLCRYTPSQLGWGHGVAGNPALVQSKGLGKAGNFEVVVPSSHFGLTHVWRDNDATGYPWRDPWRTAQAVGQVDAVTMVQSTLANPGPLEVAFRVGQTLSFLWRDSTGAFAWHDPIALAQGVGGVPSLVQSRLGTKGNFELLVPSANAGVIHLWRNNDVHGYPWSAPKLFGANLGRVDAVSLIHGTLGGGAGMLEAVMRVGSRLVHLTRDNTAVWRTGPTFGEGVAGNPALIQSSFADGSRNFEVVVPSASGGLIHYYRNNGASTPFWSAPRPFAASLGQVDAVAMIQSNFDGHLEVLARVGDELHMVWRSSGPGATWSAPRRVF
ncbi:conserved hypothetical protein [Frankia canadensis]|uniref:PLL-like beta propeller domain-containing protein n=1 Tax=Frankia canadensis TaxID=1836972 RepID=A0A2I2KLH6_9ACTN|nr:hypothetical protein [Frankia canadensis]SNQ46521.1 conserved hypothetical protein [Frankia canadensis]SOU53811.1 conserved hypothetical protein [Frankia canadensis]